MPKKTIVGVEDVDFKIVSYVDGVGEQHTCLFLVRDTPKLGKPEVYLFEENMKSLGASRAADWLADLIVSSEGSKKEKKSGTGSSKSAAARAKSPRQV